MCFYAYTLYSCNHRLSRFPVTVCKAQASIARKNTKLNLSEGAESLTHENSTLTLSEDDESLAKPAESGCPSKEPSPDKAHERRAERPCDYCISIDMDRIIEAQVENRSKGLRNCALKEKFDQLMEMIGMPEEGEEEEQIVGQEMLKMGNEEGMLAPAEDEKDFVDAENEKDFVDAEGEKAREKSFLIE